MTQSIYQIQQDYLSITNELIENGGELSPELETSLAINKAELQQKAVAYIYVTKSLEADVSTIDDEIKRLQALKASRVKTIDKLKETVKSAMEMYEIEEIKTATLKINFRKSESIEADAEQLQDYYCVLKTTRTPDKAKIKEAIKNGEAVIGASLKINRNIQIK
jgi:hypothetical protein